MKKEPKQMLIAGLANLTYTDEKGKTHSEKIKIVGRFGKDDEHYFEGANFNMASRLEGSLTLSKKDFYSMVSSWHEVF